MDPQNLSDEHINAVASQAVEAVEQRLKIGDFIGRHFGQIVDGLEEAADEPHRKDRFLDDALPVIDSVIHVGSSRENYMNALPWAKQTNADPDRWLTLLTFVYIVRKAVSECSKGLTKGRIWSEIESSVATLLRESTAKTERKEPARGLS